MKGEPSNINNLITLDKEEKSSPNAEWSESFAIRDGAIDLGTQIGHPTECSRTKNK